MSDDEKLRLRDLPPVEPVPIRDRSRFSQTLLAKADACLRSAYLYMRYNGGPGSHAMDRGSLVHEAAERMMLDLIRYGERSMLELALHQGPGGALVAEDIVQAEGELASMTKAIVDEILSERADLNPTSLECDAARAMVWHIAIAQDVDPEKVLGVERKFVLDLPCGVTVSGKIDLLSAPDAHWLQVDDLKTTFNAPPEEEFDELHSFQVRLYAALVMFGNPVEKDEAGVEVRLPNVGEGVFYARGRQLYPRPKPRELPTGRKELVQREKVFTRTELADFLVDVDRIAKRLLDAFETWKFPAIPGRHCSECPAAPECPLPSHLRRYAGIVNSHDEAAEAYAWALTQGDRVSATIAEVKAWAKHHGPIVIGDELYGFEVKPTARAFKTRKGRDMKEEFVAAAAQVARYGGELVMDDFLRPPGVKNEFGPMKASAELVQRRREEIDGGREVNIGELGGLEHPPGGGSGAAGVDGEGVDGGA